MTESPTRKKVPSVVWHLVRIAVVVLIFWFMFKSGALDLHELKRALSNPMPFVIGVLLLIVSTLISVQRWRKLLEVQQIHATYWDALRLTFIGLFFNTVIPGAVSGDIVKAYYVVKGRPKKAEAVMAILLDRIIGMFTMVVVAFVVIVLAWTTTMTGVEEALKTDSRVKVVALLMAGIFAAMVVAFALASNKALRVSAFMKWLLAKLPFKKTIQELYDAVYLYGRYPKETFQAVLWSFVTQVPLFGALVFMARAVRTDGITLGGYLFMFPVGLIVNALPLLPGGLGQGEAAFGWLFELFGSDRGAEVALLFHVGLALIAITIGGFFYLVGKKNYAIDMADRS